MDYAALSAVNPDVVMCAISGFGDSGPYVEARVYDQVIQAMSGVGAVHDGALSPGR